MTPLQKLARVNAIAKRKGIKEEVHVSSRESKKYMVRVNGKLVHFGQAGAEDYLDHKDERRRRSYLARARGIRDGSGKLTHRRKSSPNFWSIELLW